MGFTMAILILTHLSGTMQKSYGEVMEDPGYLDSILADGAAKANVIASSTLDSVYNAMGFVPRRKPVVI